MEQVMVVGCGAYMSSGYGCPGEWRCLKAAAKGEGSFEREARVVGFVTCECPGRSVAPNLGMAIRLSEVRPDRIHLSSCLANAKPECPYATPEELAAVIEKKTGVPVTLGTHAYA